MTVSISSEMNDVRLAAALDYLNLGGTPAIDFYEGARPSNGGIPSGALLGTIDLPAPCATLTSHALVFICPQDGLVISSGLCTWARFRNGSDDHAMDLDVSLSGDGGDIIVASAYVYAGGTIRLVSGVIG